MEPRFEAWDRVEDVLDGLKEETTTYFTLRDRTSPGTDEDPCGKLVLEDDAQMKRYREEEDPEGWPGTLQAVRRWIKRTAKNNIAGVQSTTFRLQSWGPKGTNLPSAQFQVILAPHEEPRTPHIQLPSFPVREDIDAGEYSEAIEAAAKGDVTALYSRLIDDTLRATKGLTAMVMTSTQSTEQVLRNTLMRSESQNRELTQTVQLLTSSILDSKRKELEAEAQALREERVEVNRKAMMANGGQLIKDTVETVVMGRTMPENIKSLLPILSEPDIQSALSDPTVLDLLRDPNNRPGFIDLLKKVGAGVASQKAAAAPTE